MRSFNSIYLILLSYIIVFIVFWGLSLERQSHKIYDLELQALASKVDSATRPAEYQDNREKLKANLGLRKYQYIGEGGSFLVLTLIGAVIVYSSLRRKMSLSRQQSNFMLSVTHELKSPIAAIKLNLQTMERHKLDEDKKNNLVSRCINESNRLNDLCNNILFASLIEGGQYKATREVFDLSELTESIVSEYSNRYPNRFVLKTASAYTLSGDKTMLGMVVNNLLENAIKYTPANTAINITLNASGKTVVLSVADLGVGIPEHERKKIFNKFYRIGNEESRKSKGTGLGLYIAANVIRQHRGKITVTDNKPSGAVFEIELPLAH